jgi:hypothetical protein
VLKISAQTAQCNLLKAKLMPSRLALQRRGFSGVFKENVFRSAGQK